MTAVRPDPREPSGRDEPARRFETRLRSLEMPRFERCPRGTRPSLAALAILVAMPRVSIAQKPAEVGVMGLDIPIADAPRVAPIDAVNGFAALKPGAYRMAPAEGGDAIDAQIYQDGFKKFLAFVIDELDAEAVVAYELRPAEPEPGDGVTIEEDRARLKIEVDGEPFAVYRPDEATKPYLYPVQGPTGAPITRGYPMEDLEGEDRDHPHQRSFWFTHGDVNGVDFWGSDPLNSPRPNHGRIVETERITVVDGPVVGVLRTANEWRDADGAVVCTDERVLRFYDTETARVIDVEVDVIASHGPVTFGDTKEGSFGLRLTSSMNVDRGEGGRILNSEGQINAEAWGQPAAWVDYTGPVKGETLGVAIFDHPRSLRHPTTWHVRNYGLFAANPFGYTDFGMDRSGELKLEEGESFPLRYRVVLHQGETDAADISNAYRAFANPPRLILSGPSGSK